MKKVLFIIMLLTSMVVMTCCTKDEISNLSTGNNNNTANTATDGSLSGNASANLGSGDLASFSVAVDKSTAEPSTTADAFYPEAEDNLDDATNSSDFTTEVAIDMSNPQTGTVNGVEITNSNGAIVCNHGSNKVCYVVSGTTSSGSLTILGEKKCKVKLNGANITSPDSAALNVLCKKRCFVYVADGTTNTLTDTKSDNEHKGALYCKGKLLFHGKGTLNVYGRHNNAIHSADYIIFNKGNNIYVNSTANHGIKANDGIFINGGIINVEVSATAAKGINCEDSIIVRGGRTTAITTGGGEYDSTESDTNASSGIKSDTNYAQYDGIVRLMSSGSGGKGLSTDGASTFYGGEMYIITSGSKYTYSSSLSSSPKGIKSDGNLTVNGGAIMVRSTGTNGEAIESKALLTINGGSVSAYSRQDDAINAAGDLSINGGYVLAYSTGNDGMDANGNFYLNGGVVYAIGASQPEVAMDANTEGGKKLYVNGGTIVAIGGLESGAQLSQSCYQASWNRNTWYSLTAGGETLAFQTPSSGGTTMVVSAASTPSLKSGVSASGGTACFGGMGIVNGSVSGGSEVSLSSYSGGAGMGGGMGPGRRW